MECEILLHRLYLAVPLDVHVVTSRNNVARDAMNGAVQKCPRPSDGKPFYPHRTAGTGVCITNSSYLLPPLHLSNTLNLNDCPVPRRYGLQTRPGGHGLRQKINIRLVHGGKVLHVGEVDVVFNNLLQGRP